MQPAFPTLELLYEADELPAFELPDRLADAYAGTIGFPEGCLYANFVSSLDGVVALEGLRDSSSVISGNSEADRFVMGLLRACADAVLIGATTMRDARRHRWTPGFIFPGLSDDFLRLRRTLGKEDEPQLVVVTASGQLDPAEPALERGAIVLTTRQAASRLRTILPEASRIVPLAERSPIDLGQALRFLASNGLRTILSEGGPLLFGQLLQGGLVDELFLTVSPLIAGGSGGRRPRMAEDLELLPHAKQAGRLLSVRRSGAYLFLRYGLGPAAVSLPSR